MEMSEYNYMTTRAQDAANDRGTIMKALKQMVFFVRSYASSSKQLKQRLASRTGAGIGRLRIGALVAAHSCVHRPKHFRLQPEQ